MDLISLSLVFLSFTGCCVGSRILPPGPVEELLGKDLTLKILLKKDPEDMIIWSFSDGVNTKPIATLRPGGLQVDDLYKDRATINSTNGYLTVKSLTSEDGGDYTITVVSNSTRTAEIKVRVLEPVSDVVIRSDPAEPIEHNSTVSLLCTSKGSFLNYTWTNNSKPIVGDGDRFTVTKAESASKLTISRVLRYDLVGPIVCTAKNSLEHKSSPAFNLTVYYGPDDVKINPSAESAEYVPSKSDFNLTCSATSNPPATFTFFHNEKEIKATGQVLTLKEIEEQGLGKTMGDYKCVAENAKTKRAVQSAPVRLSVIEPITGITVTGPTGILMAGNSSANLSCQAKTGNVTSTVWLKDGKALSASSNVIFASDSSSIFFNMLQKEDNGNYTCRLTNSVSKQEAHFPMVVNYGPESPRVKGEEAVKIDEKVELICSVLSVPSATFVWKINGTVIITQKEKVLVIENAKYKDSGTYTCEASNSITGKSVTSSHNLSVKEEIEDGLSDGAIAGIVIACLVAVGVSLGLFFYCRQKLPVDSPY